MNSIVTFRQRNIGRASTLALAAVCASLLCLGAYIGIASIAYAETTPISEPSAVTLRLFST